MQSGFFHGVAFPQSDTHSRLPACAAGTASYRPAGQENHHRERRAVAVAIEVEHRLVDVGDEDMGLVGRLAAVGDQPDHVQVVEGPDRPERDRGHQHRLQQRQRDVHELLPARSPIDAGRLVEFLRDPLQAAQRDDHHERKAQPDVGDDAGGEQAVGSPSQLTGSMPRSIEQMHALASRLTAPYSYGTCPARSGP